MSTYSAGRTAEGIAAQYLQQLGYRILHRNVRTRFGEIDLIAQLNDTIVFVEVKSSRCVRGSASIAPEDHVTRGKLNHLRMAILSLREYAARPQRLDIICIMHGRVEQHIQGIEFS